jgi:lipopolysaccharide export system permease protein
MKTLALYLIRQFLVRCALVLVGTAAFALAADLMEAGKNVVSMREDSWRVLLDYGLLRLPTYVSALLPVSALIAGLWTVGVMYRQKELVAILNTGLSPIGLIRLVLLGSLPLVFLQFLLDDRIVPRAIQELRSWDWAESGYEYFSPETDGWLWLYSGRDIVRMEYPRPRSRTFSDVTIFRRDAEGLLLERIDAPVARFMETGLVLENAVIQSATDAGARSIPSYRWLGRIDFNIVQMLSWAPADLSLSQLNEVIDNAGYGQRPVNIYRTWFNARLVAADSLLLENGILCLDLPHGNLDRICRLHSDRHHDGHGRGGAVAAVAGRVGPRYRTPGADRAVPPAARGPHLQSPQSTRPGVTGGKTGRYLRVDSMAGDGRAAAFALARARHREIASELRR